MRPFVSFNVDDLTLSDLLHLLLGLQLQSKECVGILLTLQDPVYINEC